MDKSNGGIPTPHPPAASPEKKGWVRAPAEETTDSDEKETSSQTHSAQSPVATSTRPLPRSTLKPANGPQMKRMTVLICVVSLLLGLGLAIGVSIVLDNNEKSRQSEAFFAQASSMSGSMQEIILLNANALTLTTRFMSTSTQPFQAMPLSSFKTITEPTLEKGLVHSTIWCPWVRADDRDEYELLQTATYDLPQRRNITVVGVLDANSTGIVSAPLVPYYVPIFLRNPPDNTSTLGFDLASISQFEERINASVSQARIVAGQRLSLSTADTTNQFGVLYFEPVYNGTDPSGVNLTVAERFEQVQGVMLFLELLGSLVETAFRGSPTENLEIILRDVTDGVSVPLHVVLNGNSIGGRSLVSSLELVPPLPPPNLVSAPMGSLRVNSRTFIANIVVGDRQWQLVFISTQSTVFSSSSIAILVFILLFIIGVVAQMLLYVRLQRILTKTNALLAELSVLYKHAPVGMLHVDSTGVVVRANAMVGAMCGLPHSSAIRGMQFSDMPRSSFTDLASHSVGYVLASGEPVINEEFSIRLSERGSRTSTWLAEPLSEDQVEGIELQHLAKPARRYTFVMSHFPVFFNTLRTTPDGVATVIQDVTEIAQRHQKAERMSEIKTVFLARMSHEIRTPINGILGNIELLSQSLAGYLKPEQRSFMLDIKNCTDLLMTLLGDILDVSKMEVGRLELERHAANVVEVIASSVDMCPQKLGVELALLVDADVSVHAHTLLDSTRLSQVVFNLVNNAIKFTSRGHVYVRVHKLSRQHLPQLSSLKQWGPHSVFVEVEDTGAGIASENLVKIFQSFTQEDTTTTRRFGGTGLGLSIARGLLELMHGELFVRSTIGVGTVFAFALPLDEVPLNLPVARLMTRDISGSLHLAATNNIDMQRRLSVDSDQSGITPLLRPESSIEPEYETPILVALQSKVLLEAFDQVASSLQLDVHTTDSEEQLVEMVKSHGTKYRTVVIDSRFMGALQTLLEERNEQLRVASSRAQGVRVLDNRDVTQLFAPLGAQSCGNNGDSAGGLDDSAENDSGADGMGESGEDAPLLLWAAVHRTDSSQFSRTGFDGFIARPSDLCASLFLCVRLAKLTALSGTGRTQNHQVRFSNTSLQTPPCASIDDLALMADASDNSSPPSRTSDVSTDSGAGGAAQRYRVDRPARETSVSHLLLVEDNMVNQRVAKGILVRLVPNCDLVLANDGEAGVAEFKAALTARRPFDMILMDCQMPVLDGYGASKAIREFEKAAGVRRTPIVALTAHAMKSDREKCLLAGMDEYLAKPLIVGDIMRLLQHFSIPTMDPSTSAKQKRPKKSKKPKTTGSTPDMALTDPPLIAELSSKSSGAMPSVSTSDETII